MQLVVRLDCLVHQRLGCDVLCRVVGEHVAKQPNCVGPQDGAVDLLVTRILHRSVDSTIADINRTMLFGVGRQYVANSRRKPLHRLPLPVSDGCLLSV